MPAFFVSHNRAPRLCGRQKWSHSQAAKYVPPYSEGQKE
jgi:hypothetical protein